MRHGLRDTIASGRLTIVLVIIGLVGGLTAGVVAARTLAGDASDQAGNASDQASAADRAAECNRLLITSIAQFRIQPRAVELGCDTQAAEQIITAELAREARVSQLEQQLRDAGLEPLPPVDSNGDGDMDLGTDPTTGPAAPQVAPEAPRTGPGPQAPAGRVTPSPRPAATPPPDEPPPPPPPDDPDDDPPLFLPDATCQVPVVGPPVCT